MRNNRFMKIIELVIEKNIYIFGAFYIAIVFTVFQKISNNENYTTYQYIRMLLIPMFFYGLIFFLYVIIKKYNKKN